MIRAIQKPDIASVAKIYNYYIENTIASYEESTLDTAGMTERVRKVIEDGFPWLVAEIDGVIGGYSYGYMWNTRSAYSHSAEVTVYLLPDYFRKGIGTQL